MRERAPSTDEKIVSLGTQRAIKAAGGLEVVAGETGRSTTQLSRLQSVERPDLINARDILTVDALAMPALGGVPPILSAIGRILGCVVIPGPGTVADEGGVQASLMEVVGEVGDVATAIREALADGEWTQREIHDALKQVDEMDAAAARLRAGLHAQLARVTKGQAA